MTVNKLTNNVKPLDEVDKINEIIDELDNIDPLPSQAGQSGKYLTTNGTVPSWAEVQSLPSQTGKAGLYLQTDGTDASWEGVPGRNIGEVVASTIPLTDAGLHLLDGSLIQGSGIYSAFVDYIAGLYEADPTANYFAQGYIEKLAFNQPALSANGTLGGDSFAVNVSSQYSSSYQAYMAFDNSSSTQWLTVAPASISFPVNLTVYNPVALNCTSIDITNRLTYSSYFTAGNVYGSNDNSTWTLIQTFTNSVSAPNTKWTIDLSNNTEYYKYYKIEFTSGVVDSGTTTASYGLTQVDLTATYQGTIITPEQEWQTSVTQYGVCGKFVYDSVNNTVRLPKVTGIIEGTTDVSVLGDLVEAGLPNITGTWNSESGAVGPVTTNINSNSGAFTTGNSHSWSVQSRNVTGYDLVIDASRSSSIYGNSSTVQPQTIKAFYYIVVATSTKTDIQVDIDEIATDLNGKADVDLSNVPNSRGILTESYVNGTSWYRVYSDGWCEQGGYDASGNGKHTINFLKPYINTDYSVFANSVNDTAAAATSISSPKTTTSFAVYKSNSGCYWQACGYIN